MTRSDRARLVFVHGIGPNLDVDAAGAAWTAALAAGMKEAGHSAMARMVRDRTVDIEFAHYADLFSRSRRQGFADEPLDIEEAKLLEDLVGDLITLARQRPLEPADARMLNHAAAQLSPVGLGQGFGSPVRRSINAVTTILQLPLWGHLGTWTSDRAMISYLRQVTRYLKRAEPDADGVSLDQRIRDRVRTSLGPGPATVLAHSLGSVVAWETLHELAIRVPLLVTFGSPLGMRTLVLPRLRPVPPATPPTVESWLNFWDKDDVIVARQRLGDDFAPNARLVRPDSRRVDSEGLWVHGALKYLAQPGLAGPTAECLEAELMRAGVIS